MFEKITEIYELGETEVFDLEIDSKYHNYYANNVCVSNSHSISYTYLFFQVLWLKNFYPRQFFTALLSNTSTTISKDRKRGTELNKLYSYINEARKYNLKVLGPDINESGLSFTLDKKNIRFGLSKIKGIKDSSAEEIIEKRPFSSFKDFTNRISGKIHKGKIVSLIQAGCFDSVGDRLSIKRQFNSIRKDQVFKLVQNSTQDSIDAYGFILLHPFYEKAIKNYLLNRYCVHSKQLKTFNRWERVSVAGIITDFNMPMSGKSVRIVKIQDHHGDMSIYLDSQADIQYGSILDKLNIIFVSGRVMGGSRILCHGSEDKIFNITQKVGELLEKKKCQKGRGLI